MKAAPDLTGLLAAVEARAAVVFRRIETLRPPASRDADSRGSARSIAAAAGEALDRLTAALDDYDMSSASGALDELGRPGPAGMGGR